MWKVAEVEMVCYNCSNSISVLAAWQKSKVLSGCGLVMGLIKSQNLFHKCGILTHALPNNVMCV